MKILRIKKNSNYIKKLILLGQFLATASCRSVSASYYTMQALQYNYEINKANISCDASNLARVEIKIIK